jgi:hypothetical protein
MVVFHIGYHKTASTWMRRAVFPNMPGVLFQPRNHGPVAEAVRALMSAPAGDVAAGRLRDVLEECANGAGKPVVVSNEDLSRNLFGGGGSGLRNAHRLHAAAPEARILIVIRRQDEMARSIHAQYINLGGYGSLSRFLAGETEGCRFDPGDLAYDELVERYLSLFGPSRVTVIPYELLAEDPGQFLGHVSHACAGAQVEVPPAQEANISLSRYSMLLLRAWNRAFRRSDFNPSPLLLSAPSPAWPRYVLQRRVEPRLPQAIARRRVTGRERELLDRFARRFGESNARTQDLIGWDLTRFGYALP